MWLTLAALIVIAWPGSAQAGDGWQVVAPGGNTGCGLDTPFEFWVREGDPSQVLVFLQGGGGCWDHETCHPQRMALFDAMIDSTDHRQRRDGIFDRRDPANPFRDYSVLFVPYCTGDFHLGARRVTYEAPPGSDVGSVTVQHAGYRNMTAVLDHLAGGPVAPSRIVVVGASAGAVASPVMAARSARRFPAALVRQLGDGAAGLRFAGSRRLLTHWGADSALAADGLDLPTTGDGFTTLYRMAAAREPGICFSQVATASDARVAAGLRLVGEDPASVESKIRATYAELAGQGICFEGYVLPGTEHTIVWRAEFLSADAGGVPLVERLRRDVLDRPDPRQDPPSAALLFEYRPRPGDAERFHEGYRQHLEWHRAHGDSLIWYGWEVLTGERPGVFIDGTFGRPFAALDQRVDPAGDAADFAATAGPWAEPIGRTAYVLRRDLSTSTPLEQGRPTRLVEVVSYRVRPGAGKRFEAVVAEVRLAIAREPRSSMTWYELVNGGVHATYTLFIHRNALGEWDDGRADLSSLIDDVPEAAAREDLRVTLGAVVVDVRSETWRYLPRSSLIPSR